MIWNGAPLWRGETCFIIAGGPSVRGQNLGLLRGRKVMVINSSVHVVPWADVLVFGDIRWWRQPENRKAVENFKGIVVTTAQDVKGKNVTRLGKSKPPGLAKQPGYLSMRRTTLTAALNLAYHFGVKRCVLLGADGKRAADGNTHHHAPHMWPSRPGCWARQKEELQTLVAPLKKAGIEVLNASPGSAWDMWPVVRLEDALDVKEKAA